MKHLAVAAVLVAAACASREPNSIIDHRGYYVRESKVLYLTGFPSNPFEVRDADPKTFKMVDDMYGIDRARAFYGGRTVQGADPTTFERLPREGFSKDAGHVFQGNRSFSADPMHFELLDSNLSRDSRYVYWMDGTVLTADPTGFAILKDEGGYLYTRDSATVFVNGNPIRGAESATFALLSGAYARDAHGVYYFDILIPTADVETFAPLDAPYAKDSRAVYWMGKPIPSADPATFRILNANFECTADALHAYYRDVTITGINPATITGPVANCGKDFVS